MCLSVHWGLHWTLEMGMKRFSPRCPNLYEFGQSSESICAHLYWRCVSWCHCLLRQWLGRGLCREEGNRTYKYPCHVRQLTHVTDFGFLTIRARTVLLLPFSLVFSEAAKYCDKKCWTILMQLQAVNMMNWSNVSQQDLCVLKTHSN